MSQYNIGPKIGIEGEKEFRAQITRINSEYRSMDSYLQALDKSMAQNGRSQEALAAKGNALRQQIDLQQRKYEELYQMLQRVTAMEGDHTQEIMRFEGALLDVRNTTAQLTQELDDTERQLDNLANGIDDVGESADSSEPKVLSFGDMLKAGIASGAILNGLERAGEMIVDIGKQAIDAAADVKAANAQFQQTFGELEGRATSALKSISDETGMAVTRLQGGYTALYAFTKSVGGDQETALNIAQRALSAAADSAAYYDRTMEDATETLQSFLKGNYANDAALGIAATETTRNAKANELYAKSFKDLSEAQKVDVLLAMVEAGNAASGALGQAAREADSWTNVTGELSEAWRQFLAQLGEPILTGLTPMIQGITGALKGMTEVKSWQTLRADVDSFTTGLAAAEAELEASNTSMAATASLAERYVGNLQALEDAGLDTAESQREYAQTVELLNGLMPELNLSIDQNTGRLAQNADAIYRNIDGLKKQAQEQAKQAYYNRIIEESKKAYEALYTAQTRETELLARKEELLARGATLYEGLSYAQTGSTDAIARFNAQLSEDDKALAEIQLELNGLTGEILSAEAAIAEAEGKFDSATRVMEDYGDAGEQAAESAAAQAEAQEALRNAYEAAKTAARESIDSQIGLFDELADKNEWSAEKILKNWARQKEAFSNYEDNLKKAVEMGLDEALVQQLSDGSQQSMMILDALVNDVEISVDEINTGFRGVSESRESVSREIALMRDDVVLILDEMSGKARAMGKDTGLGVAQGIRDAIPDMEAAMRRLANKGIYAYAYEMDQHSPSRVMRAKGKDSGLGAALGVEDSIPDMERAMVALATAGQESYAQQQLDYVAQYPSMMQGVPGYGGGTTTNTRNVAYGGISININTQPGQDAHSIADAVLEELTVRLGQEEASW